MTDATASRLERATGRWQRNPRRVDVITAGTWVVLTLVPALNVQATGPAHLEPFGYILAIAVIAVIAVAQVLMRRRRPVLLFVISIAAPILLIPFGFDFRTLAAAYAVFAIAVYDQVRRAWIAGVVAYGLTIVQSLLHLLTGFGLSPVARDASITATVISYLVFDLLLLLVALFWGQNAGNRRRYVDALLERARVLEHERDQEAQLATLAERSRIARDVHDIVSHSLSVIVRLSDGARAVLDTDPPRAREAVGQIGGVARSSLDEMRRALGVLERAPEGTPPRSSTGLDDLPRLIEVYRGVGLPVLLDVSVEEGVDVPAGIQMTVFRVVQEALTNAMRHAADPTRVAVEVRVSSLGVSAEVRDDGALPARPSADGRIGKGLVGMRERATLYGGTVEAAPAGDGPRSGWSVRLELPAAAS